jgi:hypothetical protein
MVLGVIPLEKEFQRQAHAPLDRGAVDERE